MLMTNCSDFRDDQVRDVVDAMQEMRVPNGCYLIREGEAELQVSISKTD